MASDKTYDISFPKPTETETDRQKTIMNKFMPVSYYEHHKLFLDTDVLKMMERYRQELQNRDQLSEIKWKEVLPATDDDRQPGLGC